MSTEPAKFFGLKNRGSIGKGKRADFFVWNPFEREVV